MITKLLIALFLIGQSSIPAPIPKVSLSADPSYFALIIKRKQEQIQQAVNEQAFYKAQEARATAEKADLIQKAHKDLKLDSTWTWDDAKNAFVQVKK